MGLQTAELANEIVKIMKQSPEGSWTISEIAPFIEREPDESRPTLMDFYSAVQILVAADLVEYKGSGLNQYTSLRSDTLELKGFRVEVVRDGN